MKGSSNADDDWILRAPARRLLTCSDEVLDGLVRDRRIAVRRVPGAFPRFHLGDIVRLLEESTIRSDPRPAA
jgi:hypothetical protein